MGNSDHGTQYMIKETHTPPIRTQRSGVLRSRVGGPPLEGPSPSPTSSHTECFKVVLQKSTSAQIGHFFFTLVLGKDKLINLWGS